MPINWSLVLSHLILTLAFAAGIVMLGAVLRQRRSPQSALAWIAFAILVPYVAVPLFFLLGRRKLGTPHEAHVTPARARARGTDPVEDLLCGFGVAAASAGNRVRLCTRAEATYASLMALLDQAQDSVSATFYVLHPDEIGRDVLAQLTERARAGVRVRLLLDGYGSLTTRSRHFRALREAGGQVAFFHSLLNPSVWLRANLRNHRKLVVVDDRIALAGGVNVAREYMGPDPRPDRWTDLAFVLEGPAVAAYAALARADWAYATGEPLAGDPVPEAAATEAGEGRVQVIASGPDTTEDVISAGVLQAAFSAHNRLWLATPYFIPDAGLFDAFALAARRGVDVRLLLPERSNHRLADWARGNYLRDLQGAGARVHLFRPGMMHAKALLVDRRLAMLGSANLDLRSLYLDYEVMTALYSEPDVLCVEKWMTELMQATRRGVPEAGRVQELFEGVIRLLAPLL
ncbi:MAG: phospholipase D-like domain-containing protein [Myxococcales bacterium]|nr:phospholipase D-like domain-containing protein [Myxococcales bacterium]MDH5306667.1 phospholipase D-like domain-containing protein [Myxococcales bacterium]MDH5565258.1 phospholipase D-like domain-containing protein [Myxococcales bacterium]